MNKKCEIKCGEPDPECNPIILSRKKKDKVTWFTNEKDVTYYIHVPPGVFDECPGSGVCSYPVTAKDSPELTVLNGAYLATHIYRISWDKLPADCLDRDRGTPVIIVTDDRPRKKQNVVKKAAPKKKTGK